MKYSLVKNKITFENRVEFTLSKEVILENNLRRKTEVSQEEYYEVIKKACESYCYYLLAIKNYFRRDLSDKLVRKYREKNIIELILDSLEEKDYINDFDSAKHYVEMHKNYGKKKLEFELRRKGIESSIMNELLEDNLENELIEIEKNISKMKDKPIEKVITSLMRKGFEYKNIRLVLERR